MKKVKNKIEIPIGIKVIAILYYIGAIFGIIAGITFILGSAIAGIFIKEFPLLATLSSSFLAAMGILMIIISTLAFIIGYGLWNAKPFARIAAIIFSGLTSFTSLISIFKGNLSAIINLLIHSVIFFYLLLNKEVKRLFRK